MAQVRIAVITPYHDEPLSYLEQCHQSVLNQTVICDHIMVADGCSRPEINGWNCDHIILPNAHQDIGSTARTIGSMHAIGLGYDYVSFLDADNWYGSDHLETLLGVGRQQQVAVVSATRMLCRIDGSLMGECPITNPAYFIDTNCMLLGREAFSLIHHWVLMPDYGHLIGDRIFWHYVCNSNLSRAHCDKPTVFYRCQKEGLYRLFGEGIPAGVLPRPDYEAAHQRWLQDGYPSLFPKP